MDTAAAIQQIRKSCDAIALELMHIHPAAAGVSDKPVRDDIYRALFELTKQVETIKKLARKVEMKLQNPGADDLPPAL